MTADMETVLWISGPGADERNSAPHQKVMFGEQRKCTYIHKTRVEVSKFLETE
jgi:hypothetical protein